MTGKGSPDVLLKPSSSRHSDHWDAIRGLSVLIMLCIHTGGIVKWNPFVVKLPQLALPAIEPIIFLSGFLISKRMHHYVLGARLPLGTVLRFYAIRRILRTWPLYFLVVAVYFLWPQYAEREVVKPLWSFLTFTANFDARLGGAMHLWSVCLEEWCYLLFGLFICFIRRPAVVWFFLAFAVYSISQRFILMYGGKYVVTSFDGYMVTIHFSTPLHWDSFWLGCIAGRWWQRREVPMAISSYFLSAAIVLTALYIFVYLEFGEQVMNALYVLNPEIGALIAFLLIVGVRAIPARFVRWTLLPKLGVMSYTVYLAHKLILHNFTALNRIHGWLEPRSWAELLAGYGTVFLACYILHRALERPLLNLLRTRLRLDALSTQPGKRHA